MSFPVAVRLRDEDVLKQTSDKRYPLGTVGYTRDGRKFRYALNGAAALSAAVLVQGQVVASAPQTTGLLADNYFATAPTTNSSAVKIRFLSTKTMMGSTANYWADGFLWVRTGTGSGQMVRILSHSGATTTAAGGHAINLAWDSRLSIAPVTTTAVRVGVIANPYSRVVVQTAVAATSKTAQPLGVTPRAITASYYFWLQVAGLCVVKRFGTVTVGAMVQATSSTATVSGAIAARQNTVSTKATSAAASLTFRTHAQNLFVAPVGQVVTVGSTANSQYCVINLTIG